MVSVRVRTLTGLVIALLTIAALFGADLEGPGIVPWLAGLGLGIVVAFELGHMGSLAGTRRPLALALLVVLAAIGMLVALRFAPSPQKSVLWFFAVQGLTLLGGILVAPLARAKESSATDSFQSAPAPGSLSDLLGGLLRGPLALGLLSAWAATPLVALALVHANYGTGALAALILLSKIGDVSGYFIGRALGRAHPFPKLSPGKTGAGCVASLCTGLAAGALAARLGILPGSPALLTGAALGGVLNLAAQAADLSESLVKRTAGVKESSSLAGASGGVLDVLDSFLFTVPVSLFLFAFLK